MGNIILPTATEFSALSVFTCMGRIYLQAGLKLVVALATLILVLSGETLGDDLFGTPMVLAQAGGTTAPKKQRCFDVARSTVFPASVVDTEAIFREVWQQSTALELTDAQIAYAVVYEIAQAEQRVLGAMKRSLYGHRKTTLVPRSQLQQVAGADAGRAEYLAPEAAQAWLRMQAAAKIDGIRLAIADSYRTYADQKYLFERNIKRRGNEAAAARWSAPPGHSEHHTGYALDLAGSDVSGLMHPIKDRHVWDWVRANGAKYGWEISFKVGNTLGINPEPWHIRYVSPRSRPLLGLLQPRPIELSKIASSLKQSLVPQNVNFQMADQRLGVSSRLQVADRALQLNYRYWQCFF